MNKHIPFLLVFGVMSGPALGQEIGRPLSSIDWLSDSIAAPQVTGPVEQTPPVDAITSVLPPDVAVRSLDAPLADAVGTVLPATLGLPVDLWQDTLAQTVAEGLAAVPTDLPPTASRFLRDLLMTRATPPIDARLDASLYFARIDKLLEIGHLDDASILIDMAPGGETPELFRRRFDIALLTGTEAAGCATLAKNPDILATFPARIFCLARNGEWEVAALTLGTAEALGFLTVEEDALLLKFLDPDLFEEDPVPPAPSSPSPLVFRLYDAIGERLPTEPLPIAFAEADLTPTVGWKTRLRAAERLTAAAAMPINRFFEILYERAPAASGGIWDRVAALQVADQGLRARAHKSGDLARGWRAANEAGIAAVLAPVWAPYVSGLDLEGADREAAFEIALLADRPALAADFLAGTPREALLYAILTEAPLPDGIGDPLARAVQRGLTQLQPAFRDLAVIANNGVGMGVLRALRRTSEGRAGDPEAVADALALLRELGLPDLARRIAVEILLEAHTA